MAEDYVRPPVIGVEPPSRRAALWRFRLVMIALILALLVVVVVVIRAIVGGGENGGTVGMAAGALILSPRAARA